MSECETIATAAVMDGASVHTAPRPARHCDVLNALPRTVGQRAERVQGFVTSTGRFVDRDEAATIAIAAGQIAALRWPPHLYSEDMW